MYGRAALPRSRDFCRTEHSNVLLSWAAVSANIAALAAEKRFGGATALPTLAPQNIVAPPGLLLLSSARDARQPSHRRSISSPTSARIKCTARCAAARAVGVSRSGTRTESETGWRAAAKCCLEN